MKIRNFEENHIAAYEKTTDFKNNNNWFHEVEVNL
jgi:hypothetical protein